MSYDIHIKQNNNYEQVQNIYIKQNGVYQEVDTVSIKNNGTYHSLKQPLINLSIGATATTNSAYSGYEANKAIDGLDNTRWASTKGTDRYLEITYPQETTLNYIIIKEYLEERDTHHNVTKSGNFKIQRWNGSNWVDVFDLVIDRNNTAKCDFVFQEYHWDGSEINKDGAKWNPNTEKYVYSTIKIKFKTQITTTKLKYLVTSNSGVSLHEFETYLI